MPRQLYGAPLANVILRDTEKEMATLSRKPQFTIFHSVKSPYVTALKKAAVSIGLNYRIVFSQDENEIYREWDRCCAYGIPYIEVKPFIVDLRASKFNADMLSVQGAISIFNNRDGVEHSPAVVQAVFEMLEHYVTDSFPGVNVVVLGRSKEVGLPLAINLINKGANVTIFNSSADPEMVYDAADKADIVIGAIGQNDMFSHRVVDHGVYIDLGEDFLLTKWKGDDVTYTPAWGGVGPVTTACAIRNVVRMYRDIWGYRA